MTLSARRLASLAGSEASYARADELLRELSGLNFGAKRIERATRAAGANPVLWLRCARQCGWFDAYWDDHLAGLAA